MKVKKQAANGEDKVLDPLSSMGMLTTRIIAVKSRYGAEYPETEEERIAKADKGTQTVISNALTVEDDPWRRASLSAVRTIVPPTYNPVTLHLIASQNNTINQCVAAYQTNIDGTGYEFISGDGKPLAEGADASLKGFFDEVYPGMSYTTLRKKIRRDMEITGNGYVEVLRNSDNDIIGLNYLDAKLIRLCVFDRAVAVDRVIIRNGKEETLRIMRPERRYAMIVGSTVRYFKEFGSIRQLDAMTGMWVGESQTGADPNLNTSPTGGTPAMIPGTEVLHFIVDPDVTTGYGVPRWLNQLPSALGSRKAEEMNLDFFDHGGLPPAIILIAGGKLDQKSETQLTNYLAGSAKMKQRAVVASIAASSGDLNAANNVKIQVERFGSERQQDSMFENYDERCHERIRGAFRLPPMFLGYSQDYNFATSQTAYMVAEAQVFKPERESFDERMNVTVIRALDDTLRIRSLPLTIKDVEIQIKALDRTVGLIKPEDKLDALNQISGFSFTFDQKTFDAQQARLNATAQPALPSTKPDTNFSRDGKDSLDLTKSDRSGDDVFVSIADDWASHISGEKTFTVASVRVMKQHIDGMMPEVRRLFNNYVMMKVTKAVHDPEGVAELLACSGDCLHQ